MSANSLHSQLVDRFNARDLQGMVNLLAPDATAEVLDAGFPVERGRDVIARTSFPHVLGLGDDTDGGRPVARLWCDSATENKLVLLVSDGALDTAMRIELDEAGTSITRIEYLVGWQRPAELRTIAMAAGLRFDDPEA